MGDRGPAATAPFISLMMAYFSRWEIGGQPQHPVVVGSRPTNFSRWEIGGQPQLLLSLDDLPHILADLRSGACRNSPQQLASLSPDFSRWEIGGQPQRRAHRYSGSQILADLRSGACRNSPQQLVSLSPDFSRWEIGGQPQDVDLGRVVWLLCRRIGRGMVRFQI